MVARAFQPSPSNQSGNILFYVLIGVVLLAGLTLALSVGSDSGKDQDQERYAIKATEVQRYGAQLQQGVMALIQGGISENDIRFAHPLADPTYGVITTNPQNQVFNPSGGNVEYLKPPAGVNDGTAWGFYGVSHIPQVGSDKAELLAVLPNVTDGFCSAINTQLGQVAVSDPCTFTTPLTPFVGTYEPSPNTFNLGSLSRPPALQGCIKCTVGNMYYYVLLAR